VAVFLFSIMDIFDYGLDYSMIATAVSTTVTFIITFAISYRATGLNIGGNFVPDPGPWNALYFSIITWTTVGYGDMTPPAGIARVVACVEAILGYVVMAFLIAALLKLMS
jgi:hypothetical protein